ncbi:hypothetical protein EON67_01495 [archaeon]|nr:MAG: hypothetical protein EON67_01495 [archaeon]
MWRIATCCIVQALRTEYEAFAADQNREAEVTMEAHRAEKAQLHATIAKLEATIDEGNAVSERAVRTARADVETKTARIAALEHELEAVRNSAEEARCAAEEERLRYQREAAEWTSRLARATVEAESADRRRASAEVQAGSLSASYAALSATASRQSQELATARERGANDLSTARAQIADAESRASAAQRETASVRADMQAALERAREEAVRAADAARHEQAELKRKLRDAQAARVAAEQRVHVITRQLTRQKRDALTDATRRTGGMGTAAAGGVGDTTTVSGLLTGQSTPATREDDDCSDEGALAMALLSTDMTGDVGGDYERTLTLALQKTNEAAALKRSLKEQTEQVHALRAELEAARRSVTTAEEARAAAEVRVRGAAACLLMPTIRAASHCHSEVRV